MLTVKITKVPGVPREVTITAGQTLGVALDVYAAEYGESLEGYELRCSDATVNRDFVPNDGDKIFLIEIIKGNK